MTATLIERIAEIVECEPSTISPESEFRSLENWDSLAYMSVVAMIDSEFSLVISQEDFRKLTTINDIAQFIQSKNQ